MKIWNCVLTLDVILRRKSFLNGESTLIRGFPRELRTWQGSGQVLEKRGNEIICYDAITRWDFSLMNQLTCTNLTAKASITFIIPIQDISFGQQIMQFIWYYLVTRRSITRQRPRDRRGPQTVTEELCFLCSPCRRISESKVSWLVSELEDYCGSVLVSCCW
jgi:hypothetical protein